MSRHPCAIVGNATVFNIGADVLGPVTYSLLCWIKNMIVEVSVPLVPLNNGLIELILNNFWIIAGYITDNDV